MNGDFLSHARSACLCLVDDRPHDNIDLLWLLPEIHMQETFIEALADGDGVIKIHRCILGTFHPHTMLNRFRIVPVVGTLFLSPLASAQEPSAVPTDDHTAREEAEGKEIWGRMQREEVNCDDLSDDQFAALGEFFMGEMTGEAHEAMNAMMTRMMGEEGEEQMHVVMGKRMSGCGGDGTLPMGNTGMMGMMPMMGMMMGGNMMGRSRTGVDSWNGASPMMRGWVNGYARDTMSSMMGYGLGFAPFGFLFMILWWGLIIAGIVALVKWIARSPGAEGGKSPLDILKGRYAKGEIDKQEFETRKKDLSSS